MGFLDRCLTHLPGIGPERAARLREGGYDSWERLDEALAGGVSRAELLGAGRGAPPGKRGGGGSAWPAEAARWRAVLAESREARDRRDLGWFVDRFASREHWRVLAEGFPEAGWLDIETTGVSRYYGHVTVIGMLRGGEFRHWVWPEPMDRVAAWIAETPLLVTFNGKRFDLPFLAHHVPGFREPAAHVDLLDVARAAGQRGGLKEIEARLGLSRPEEVAGMGGYEAVVLWHLARGGDVSAFHRLLAYNKADVEMMPRVAARLLGEFYRRHPEVEGVEPIPGAVIEPEGPRQPGEVLPRVRAAGPALERLLEEAEARLGHSPVVVGIDLRASPDNPTGWARLDRTRLTTSLVSRDVDILGLTSAAAPDLVAIDAPLSRPRGGAGVREAERVLASRRVPAYPPLMPGMRALTERGMELARGMRERGLEVVECFPGAAQDALGLPRKQDDLAGLAAGLARLGLGVRDGKSHDELDATTAALVGLFCLAGRAEAVGDPGEGVVMVPVWTATGR